MSEFDVLLKFVTEHFPPEAIVTLPNIEVAVDGLIFRPKPYGGFIFLNENGEQEVTLAEATAVLEDELKQYE